MQNAPQGKSDGALGNTLDAGALRSFEWPVKGPDLYVPHYQQQPERY